MTFGLLILIVVTIIFFVVLNLSLTWRLLSLRVVAQPNKPKHFSALMFGDPIEPTTITDEKFSLKTTDKERSFYSDFADFSAIINTMSWGQFKRNPWRLQELPDTELNPTSFDRSFKRHYDIFYNRARVGKIEISPSDSYSAEKPYVYTDINLQFVRLISFDAVERFLTEIAYLVTDKGDYATSRDVITVAETESLWKTQELFYSGDHADNLGELELSFDGAAFRYFSRRDILREERGIQ